MQSKFEGPKSLLQLQRDAAAQQRRNLAAQYIELLRRNDTPRPGDSELLTEVMRGLGRNAEQLAADVETVRKIQQKEAAGRDADQLGQAFETASDRLRDAAAEFKTAQDKFNAARQMFDAATNRKQGLGSQWAFANRAADEACDLARRLESALGVNAPATDEPGPMGKEIRRVPRSVEGDLTQQSEVECVLMVNSSPRTIIHRGSRRALTDAVVDQVKRAIADAREIASPPASHVCLELGLTVGGTCVYQSFLMPPEALNATIDVFMAATCPVKGSGPAGFLYPSRFAPQSASLAGL